MAVHPSGYPARSMRYRLIVLTHGDSAPLARTIASFQRYVTPEPADRHLSIDGPAPKTFPAQRHPYFNEKQTGWWGGPHGFCESLYANWMAYGGDYPQVEHQDPLEDVNYVFWLEHDFEFTRPVDLVPLAGVLDADPWIAQMALMRDPVNHAEREAGGVYESRPDTFKHRWGWLEHTAYFTTNPSLMTRDFMTKNLPHVEDHCEGKFSIDLAERGYRFGVWGAGEPWVHHIGERTGFGY